MRSCRLQSRATSENAGLTKLIFFLTRGKPCKVNNLAYKMSGKSHDCCGTTSVLGRALKPMAEQPQDEAAPVTTHLQNFLEARNSAPPPPPHSQAFQIHRAAFSDVSLKKQDHVCGAAAVRPLACWPCKATQPAHRPHQLRVQLIPYTDSSDWRAKLL